jgi:cytochrome P450
MAEESPSRAPDIATEYDMNSAWLANNWDAAITEMHARCPMARSEIGEGYWVLGGHADVSAVAADWETFSNSSGFMPNRPTDMPFLYPEECDPPFHKNLRKRINPFFGPKAVRAVAPLIRGHALDLVSEIGDQPEVDLVPHYANALSARSFIISVARMPVADIDWLQRTLDAGIIGPVEGRGRAFQDAFSYCDDFLRKSIGSEDNSELVQSILDLEFDGYGWQEKVSTLVQLTLGGVGTTGFVLASALHYLSGNDEVRTLLRTRPEAMPPAIEEFIRFFAASPQDGRRVTTPVEVAGRMFQPEDYILLNYGAASRDPAVFDRPDEIDVGRPLPSRHLAFGWGIHRCIGSHLARAILDAGLSVFLASFSSFSVPAGFVPRYQVSATRVLETLPMVLVRSE